MFVSVSDNTYDKVQFVKDFGEVLGHFMGNGRTRISYRAATRAMPEISIEKWLMIRDTLVLLKQYQLTLGILIDLASREEIAMEMAFGSGLHEFELSDLTKLRKTVDSSFFKLK